MRWWCFGSLVVFAGIAFGLGVSPVGRLFVPAMAAASGKEIVPPENQQDSFAQNERGSPTPTHTSLPTLATGPPDTSAATPTPTPRLNEREPALRRMLQPLVEDYNNAWASIPRRASLSFVAPSLSLRRVEFSGFDVAVTLAFDGALILGRADRLLFLEVVKSIRDGFPDIREIRLEVEVDHDSDKSPRSIVVSRESWSTRQGNWSADELFKLAKPPGHDQWWKPSGK